MSHTHIILGAGVADSKIWDWKVVGAWCILHIIIAIDHCILHSHYIGVKKCLAQRFCVAIRKSVPISIGRILCCYTQKCSYINRNDFAYSNQNCSYNMGVILRIETQNNFYVKRNDFAYSNATSLLYNMGVDGSVPLRYLNDAIPLYIGEI